MKKYVHINITIHIACECGYSGPISASYPNWMLIPGYTNDSGTSWPTEIHVECPACHGRDEYPNFVEEQ